MNFRNCLGAIFYFSVFLQASASFADCNTDLEAASPVGQWLDYQQVRSEDLLLRNVFPLKVLPGTVVASTSAHYFYHWTRDAALVMTQMVQNYQRAPAEKMRSTIKREIDEFLNVSRLHQLQSGPDRLGDAKYNPDGTRYSGEWATPQNDGPAARATVVCEFIFAQAQLGHDPRFLRDEYFGDPENVKTTIHDKAYVLREDLNYLIKNWRKESADLWEETFAQSHAYTLMSFESAFFHGIRTARFFGDIELAQTLERELAGVRERLNEHWSRSEKIIVVSKNLRPHVWNPHTDHLDASTVLGVLYFSGEGSVYQITSPHVMATVHRLVVQAREDFPEINQARAAPAVGRYRGDAWTGLERSEAGSGNPWVLITAGMAEYHYRLAREILKQESTQVSELNQDFLRDILSPVLAPEDLAKIHAGNIISQTDALYSVVVKTIQARGDEFLLRIKEVASANGSLSEQISKKDSKFGVGPENLTWSHLAFLRANEARKHVLRYVR